MIEKTLFNDASDSHQELDPHLIIFHIKISKELKNPLFQQIFASLLHHHCTSFKNPDNNLIRATNFSLCCDTQ